MARLPVSPEALVAQFGPRLGFPPKEGFPGRDEPDRVVPTHCCFCGMQCGIKLLVKDNRVVGFDPWEEFPFNEGRLCPKGVQRYLQNNHPDRLLSPLERVEGVGFRPVAWDAARYHAEAKNRAKAAEFGREAFRILETVERDNDLAPVLARVNRRARASAHRVDARYLLDGGQPAAALSAWMRALFIHPPTALKRMNICVSALLNLLGLGTLREAILRGREKRYR